MVIGGDPDRGTQKVIEMSKLARKATEWAEHNQSRRGFLATCGKVTLGLGLAMAGLSRVTRTAHAQCCPAPICNAHTYPCPPTGCPVGCGYVAWTTCCDTGTGFWHKCHQCDCGGATCYYEEPTGIRC